MDLTMDCADAGRMAEFYKLAMGYVDEPPPAPFATREEWLAQFDDDEEDGGGGAWLHDPTGVAPRLCLLEVPEPKTAKNRLHIDLRVARGGTPEQRWAAITAEADRLVAAGASRLAEFTGHHIVLADPEGNEFCLGGQSTVD
ncbi:VOC family protein [Actinokineospora sp. NBRC 105648]|uniref:VOC family protein n=1 Tax=Actinokineospora sp. NBRC 105648 TaxID=3032206 RepID=UPI002553C5D2|nr:VOC family protein [Actinokineospora sp. NBRC 105648]